MNKLYILCGLPFSGKTRLAKEMVKFPKVTRIDLDEIKFEMFGAEIEDSDIDQKGWDKIYSVMYQRIKRKLEQGFNVVNDTGNFTKHEREKVSDIARELNKQFITIYVSTPESIAYQRLLDNRKVKQRFDVGDEDFRSTVQEMEIPRKDENVIIYNGISSPEVWIKENIKF